MVYLMSFGEWYRNQDQQLYTFDYMQAVKDYDKYIELSFKEDIIEYDMTCNVLDCHIHR